MGKVKEITVVFLSFFFCITTAVHAAQTYDECLKNFKIENADFNDKRVEKYIPYLKDYFLCRAIRSNSPDQCVKLGTHLDKNNLMTECINCVKEFNSRFRFYSDAYFGNIPPQEIESKCISARAGNSDICRRIASIFNTKDVSLCASEDTPAGKSCRSYVTLNPLLATDAESRDVVFYLSAYKAKDPDICRNISSSDSKSKACSSSCRFLLGKEGVCESDKGVERFRKAYCQAVTAPEQQEEALNEEKP